MHDGAKGIVEKHVLFASRWWSPQRNFNGRISPDSSSMFDVTTRERERESGKEKPRRVLTNRPFSLPSRFFSSSFFLFFSPSPAESPRLIPRNVFGRSLAALSLPPSTVTKIFFLRFVERHPVDPPPVPRVSNLFAIPWIDSPCLFRCLNFLDSSEKR